MAWRALKGGERCPVCNKKSWCGVFDDGARWSALRCMRYWNDGLEVPAGWRRPFTVDATGKAVRDALGQPHLRQADDDGGQVFVRDDGDFRPPAPTPEERKAIADTRRRNDEYAQRERERAAAKARAIWQKAKRGDNLETMIGTAPAYLDGCGPDHPRARAYFEARGIPMAALPGGKLPPSIRYLGTCEREAGATEGAKADTCPAVIAAFADPVSRRVTAVQRIYLNPDGSPTKAPGDADHQKRSRGSFSMGQAVWLTPPDKVNGTLIIAEGVETAVACLAACTKEGRNVAAVWCVVSTSGMKALRLSEADVIPAAGGWVKRVIIAADLDRAGKTGKRPGGEAAQRCFQNLTERWPELDVKIVTPTHADAPDLVDEKGEIIGEGKSVDWLDVVARYGAKEAAKRLVPEAGAARPLILPAEGSRRAQIVLRRMFAPDGSWAGKAWKIARFAGEWWVYWSGSRPHWRKTTDEVVRAKMRLLLDKYQVATATRGLKPAALTDRAVGDILSAMLSYTAVMSDRMPTWLPAAFDPEGRPVFESPISFHQDDEPDAAEGYISFPNGLLNIAAWKQGRIEMQPPTPRLFSASCLPWPFPVEVFSRAGNDVERMQEIAEAQCPEWCSFLRNVFGGDESRIEQLQQFIGYIFSPSNWLEKMCWLQSPPGSGKSTILDVIIALLGFDNVAPIEPYQLSDKFGLGPLVGRMFYPMDEFRVGRHTDSMSVLDRLLKIASGAAQATEDKFSRRTAPIVLPGKIMVATNGSPPFSDPAFAMGRRLLLLTLEPKVGDADAELKGRLVAGARNILPWALVGLRRLMLAGKFVQPEAGKSVLDDMRRQQSPVHAFADDRCIVQAGSSVQTDLLWKAWEAWCEEDGKEHAGSRETLGRRLSEVYGVRRVPLPGVRGRYVWQGIRMRWAEEGGRSPKDTCGPCCQWDAEDAAAPAGTLKWPHSWQNPHPPFME